MHQLISAVYRHRQLPLPGLEPSCMSTKHSSPVPVQRLNRVQQLTLNTWRLASAKLERVLDPCSLLEHAAIYATLGALPDVDEPLDLFRRHAEAQPEFALIVSLIRAAGQEALAYDMLDTAFLPRWDELVSSGNGPEGTPSLRPRQPAQDHDLDSAEPLRDRERERSGAGHREARLLTAGSSGTCLRLCSPKPARSTR